MKTRFILCCFIILFLNLTCGLEQTIPVLSPPGNGTFSDINDTFTFRMTDDQLEKEFRGFELYYRFYTTNEVGSLAEYETVGDLESHSFRRISYYIDDDDCDTPTFILKPMIIVPEGDRGIPALFTIDFHDMKNACIMVQDDDPDDGEVGMSEIRGQTQLEIRRGIEDLDNEGFLKSFEYFTLTGDTPDADVLGIATLEENQPHVYLILYAASYGRYNFSETLYSEVNYLGVININNENNITIIE